jgi:threonyl-tRNA synthetase
MKKLTTRLEHSLSKTPILMICGSKEQENQSITLRRLGQEKQDTLPLKEAVNLLVNESLAPKI